MRRSLPLCRDPRTFIPEPEQSTFGGNNGHLRWRRTCPGASQSKRDGRQHEKREQQPYEAAAEETAGAVTGGAAAAAAAVCSSS